MEETVAVPVAEKMPAELRRFNWAAFLAPVVWSLAEGPRIWALVFFLGGVLFNAQMLWIGVMPFIAAGVAMDWQMTPVGFIVAMLAPRAPALQLTYALALGMPVAALQVWYGFRANALTWKRSGGRANPASLRRTQRVILGVAALALVPLIMLHGASWYAGVNPSFEDLMYTTEPPGD